MDKDNPNSVFAILRQRTRLIAALMFFVVALSKLVSASELPQFDYGILKGVDTVAVAGAMHGGFLMHDLLPPLSKPIPDDNGHLPPSPILLAVKEVFSNEPWVSIKSLYSLDSSASDNIIVFSFALSAQQGTLNGRNIKVGSLSLQLQKYRSHESPKQYAVAYTPIAYPFLIPETEEQLNKTVADGVRFLTAHLPSYFICANKHGSPTKQCPDCSLKACKVDRPSYQIQSQRAKPCLQVKGQGTPVPFSLQCATTEETAD